MGVSISIFIQIIEILNKKERNIDTNYYNINTNYR